MELDGKKQPEEEGIKGADVPGLKTGVLRYLEKHGSVTRVVFDGTTGEGVVVGSIDGDVEPLPVEFGYHSPELDQ